MSDSFVQLVRERIGEVQLAAILEIPNNAVGVIATAFQYGVRFRPSDRSNLREAFTPMFEFADGKQVPPRIADLTDDFITIWAEVSTRISHPGAVSRISDLLFCRGAAEAGAFARSAIDSYINLMQSSWTPLEVTHALMRAYLLAQGTHDGPRVNQVALSIEQHYWSNINLNSPPGITIPLIEMLLVFDDSSINVDRMISAARESYREPHIADQIIAWQLRRSADKEQRKVYARERVDVWLDAADRAEPLVRVMHLQTAAEYVDDVNDPGLKQRVRALLQDAGSKDLGLKRVASGITLPQEEIERYLLQFTEADGWQQALNDFSRHPPPTGSYDENTRIAEEIDVPLLFKRLFLAFG